MVQTPDRENIGRDDRYWRGVVTGSVLPPKDFPAAGYQSPYRPEDHTDKQELPANAETEEK